jgi:hypothetical protein
MKPAKNLEVEKIEDEHAPHLDNIINGGLMRTNTPEHIEDELLKRGLIYRATGGLMPTDDGQRALMQWQKENFK